ncbi:uracil-DNA glycosylase [Vibrio antiquarius]|uniref:Uracil-DNA glycosylase n=1 Tax=Vibrio parahaemolyticus TaxID=670 RepID=A0AA46UR80_VIBPH|nr:MULTISPECIES: uracil-DNA glycosylase [Vibrio harveyi group]MCS0315175.1 uracil-DNA glycosylase [Vibrio diabolicus]UYV30270.1 uracil-DNA glycosylase [Vibrio parahaemolyticus]UYW19721.1 uracil-DNA glycosylase [Vibrio parahaemolyticus]
MTIIEELKLLNGWDSLISSNYELLCSISEKLEREKSEFVVYPPEGMVFNAFKRTSIDNVRCVIIGQDPYINQEFVDGRLIPQAMGMSFSVPKGVKPPRSLNNIYKELKNCYPDFQPNGSGDLSKWADTVLLLNATLTVRKGSSNSHKKLGWNEFTNDVIQSLIKRDKPLVFLSWGKDAHKITKLAEGSHHCVIKTSHPSPLGANKQGMDFVPFLGSKCFEKCNQFLLDSNQKTINWINL